MTEKYTFGFELEIFDLDGARHQFRVHVELPTSSCDEMAILQLPHPSVRRERSHDGRT
jgi:hypothetical protein